MPQNTFALLRLLAAFAVPGILLHAPSSASAADRIALVIGNNKYVHGAPLSNAVNDATSVSTELKKLGFSTLLETDARHEDMDRKLAAFRKSAEKAQIALFFYAGHALEIQGQNYLVPIDAVVAEQWQIKHKTVSLEEVLDAMNASKARVKILVLDACRDNPLGRDWRRGVPKGLAVAQIPDETILVFATSPGRVALDGRDQSNSPFTTAFVRYLGDQNLDFDEIFKRTGRAVIESTAGEQRPWMSSNLLSDIFLGKHKPLKLPPPPVEDKPRELTRKDQFKEAFRRSKASNSFDGWRSFLDTYASHQFAAKDDGQEMLASAHNQLGFFYYYGDRGARTNRKRAVKHFRFAANVGVADSQTMLGYMYNNALGGLPQNTKEASKLYLAAAKQGDATAQNNIGYNFDVGRGVAQNDIEAVRWYRASAEQGFGRAQFHLGLMYANGRGVPRNNREAQKWFRKSARNGYEKAERFLNN